MCVFRHRQILCFNRPLPEFVQTALLFEFSTMLRLLLHFTNAVDEKRL